MPDTTPNLDMPLLAQQQASAEVNVNEALNRLDGVVQLSVKDRDLTSPPAGTDGDAYIVGGSATGAWSGHDDEIALYYGGWVFVAAREGQRAWVQDEDLMVRYDGSSWVSYWPTHVPVHTDGNRPAAGVAGRVIFNTTDGQLNVDDGTNWTLPDGTVT